MQISQQEFKRVPLRVHAFLAGVPLHDVWAIDLPRPRGGITLDEFLRVTRERLYTPSPVVRALVNLRFFVGRLFGWDRTPSTTTGPETFADRLTGEVARAGGGAARRALPRGLPVRERTAGRAD